MAGTGRSGLRVFFRLAGMYHLGDERQGEDDKQGLNNGKHGVWSFRLGWVACLA